MTIQTTLAPGVAWPYLGVSYAPVVRYRSRALLTTHDIELMQALKTEGLACNIIAKRFKVCTDTVQRALRGDYKPRR